MFRPRFFHVTAFQSVLESLVNLRQHAEVVPREPSADEPNVNIFPDGGGYQGDHCPAQQGGDLHRAHVDFEQSEVDRGHFDSKEAPVESVIATWLKRYEAGALSRRQLIQGLAMLATAAAPAPAEAAAFRSPRSTTYRSTRATRRSRLIGIRRYSG